MYQKVKDMIIKFNYINSKGNAEGAFIAYPHSL